jgi:hypothetical protein
MKPTRAFPTITITFLVNLDSAPLSSSPLAVEKQAFAVLAVLFSQVGKQAIGVLRRLCFIKLLFSLANEVHKLIESLLFHNHGQTKVLLKREIHAPTSSSS